MKMFILVLLITTVSAFDLIREAFKYVDNTVDPCENFYRHACPITGVDGFMIVHEYADVLFKLKVKESDAPWNNLEIVEALKRTRFREFYSPTQFIADLFQKQCEDANVSRHDLENYVNQITYYLYGKKDLSALALDHNCTRATGTLKYELSSYGLGDTGSFIYRAVGRIRRAQIGLQGANAILNGDDRDGVTIVQGFVEEMKAKLTSWINQTSWAVNNDAVDPIITETLQLNIYDNYAESLRENLDYLFRLELDYLKCVRDTKNDEDHQVFCMIMAVGSAGSSPDIHFFTYFNANNDHPTLHFSHLLYDMAKNVKELAGVLGSVGYIVGHEVSHSLIEDPNVPELLPYSSNDSIQCIQNQYQKTCDTFKEGPCGVLDNQIDENGADMLGMQLAYSLFEDAYGGRMRDEYIRIAVSPDSYQSITMEQLFFYSTAFVSCKGVAQGQELGDDHSPAHIRANAMAQHPGFRQAFNCASDSKMVQSFTDQCIIYGEGAPESRR